MSLDSLPSGPLTGGSPTRARQVVAASLRHLVGRLEPGDRLPAERALCAQFGVARMTLRHALEELTDEGLIERRHGSGTYVLPQPVRRSLGLTSFSEDMRQRGLTPTSRLMGLDRSGATPALAAGLGIDADTPVLRIERLRLGSGTPFAVETVWIPARYVPGLSAADLDGSLYELLGRRYGIVTTTAQVTLEPVLPDPATATLLEIGPQQPCLSIRMVDRDPARRTVMLADCIYRGDRYTLTAQVTRFDAAIRPDQHGRRVVGHG